MGIFSSTGFFGSDLKFNYVGSDVKINFVLLASYNVTPQVACSFSSAYSPTLGFGHLKAPR